MNSKAKMLQERKNGKTILTFGVFDLLHIGHIIFFKRAKELGDKLIVAVQEGDWVRKFKPEANLIYTTEERLFFVDSIKWVDEVIIYKSVEDDIKSFDFDIWAKGPDQNHTGIQNAIRWCQDKRKEVVTIPRTEGISSTILRNYYKNSL